MDMSQILEAISRVGFPIVCCGALLYINLLQFKMHKEESDKMTEALNNNTIVITKLVDKMEGMNPE